MSAEILSLRGRVVIVGAGIAGLMTALELAPRPVVVLSKGPLGAESSTLWAQGGLAAAIGASDSPALHAADTLAAGDGLCDAAIVDRFAARRARRDLEARAARRALRSRRATAASRSGSRPRIAERASCMRAATARGAN